MLHFQTHVHLNLSNIDIWFGQKRVQQQQIVAEQCRMASDEKKITSFYGVHFVVGCWKWHEEIIFGVAAKMETFLFNDDRFELTTNANKRCIYLSIANSRISTPYHGFCINP